MQDEQTSDHEPILALTTRIKDLETEIAKYKADRTEATPQEMNFFTVACGMLTDIQLEALLFTVAHAVAHRMGVYEKRVIKVLVNGEPGEQAPEEEEKPNLIILPGGQ